MSIYLGISLLNTHFIGIGYLGFNHVAIPQLFLLSQPFSISFPITV
nr:MAG TPA: hypothetical protein [Caudoviricetes sp.]